MVLLERNKQCLKDVQQTEMLFLDVSRSLRSRFRWTVSQYKYKRLLVAPELVRPQASPD